MLRWKLFFSVNKKKKKRFYRGVVLNGDVGSSVDVVIKPCECSKSRSPNAALTVETNWENKDGTRHGESFIQIPKKHRLAETPYAIITLLWKQISGAVCAEVSGIPPGIASGMESSAVHLAFRLCGLQMFVSIQLCFKRINLAAFRVLPHF